MEIASREFPEDFLQIFREYLEFRSEAVLNRGREFAKRALDEGCGVTQMVAIQRQAFRYICADTRDAKDSADAAEVFFAACLASFENYYREARDGARALRRFNENLEAELRRIARALHDESGQLLAAVHFALAEIAAELPPRHRGRVESIRKLLEQTESQLRKLTQEVCPTELDNLGLVPALEFLANRVTVRTGLRVYVSGNCGVRLPQAVETSLYRIVQEALSNAVRHARAQSVRIDLQGSPSRVACSVRDDGSGFDTQQPTCGLGLIGIRERLNALGGSLRVVSKSRHGTTLLTDIPIGG